MAVDVTSVTATAPTVVFTAPWGRRAGQLGHAPARESAPLGPASFTVDAAGHVHVLDIVNDRIVVFGPTGQAESVVPLRSKQGIPVEYADLASLDKGRHAVVDRIGARLLVLDDKGKIEETTSFAGHAHIPSPGLVTGLLIDDANTAWLDVEHARHVRLLPPVDPLDGAFVSGTPSRNRKLFIGARLERPRGVRVLKAVPRGTGASPFAELAFSMQVAVIQSLDVTDLGGVWLSVLVVEERQTTPFDVVKSELMALELSPAGALVRRVQLPESTDAGEVLRPSRLGQNGLFYAMIRGKKGVSFLVA